MPCAACAGECVLWTVQVLLLSIGAVYIGHWLHFMFMLRAFDIMCENYASGEYTDLYVHWPKCHAARTAPHSQPVRMHICTWISGHVAHAGTMWARPSK